MRLKRGTQISCKTAIYIKKDYYSERNNGGGDDEHKSCNAVPRIQMLN
jgi:hypothetical protein